MRPKSDENPSRWSIHAKADPNCGDQTPWDEWWSLGGALLWNVHGGFGVDFLELDDFELRRFQAQAAMIPGWSAGPGSDACDCQEPEELFPRDCPFNVARADRPNNSEPPIEPILRDLDTETPDFTEHLNRIENSGRFQPPTPGPFPGQCCADCGAALHPLLARVSGRVEIDTRSLNHILYSLAEAIAYSQGKGPNHFRTWEARLQELLMELQKDIDSR